MSPFRVSATIFCAVHFVRLANLNRFESFSYNRLTIPWGRLVYYRTMTTILSFVQIYWNVVTISFYQSCVYGFLNILISKIFLPVIYSFLIQFSVFSIQINIIYRKNRTKIETILCNIRFCFFSSLV